MSDDFDDFVVEMEQGDEDEHDGHIDKEGENSAGDKLKEFGETVMIFYLEDETAVSKVGKENGDDPRNNIGDLELESIFRIKEGENECVISAEANKCSEDANNEIADNLGVFGVFGADEMEEFLHG